MRSGTAQKIEYNFKVFITFDCICHFQCVMLCNCLPPPHPSLLPPCITTSTSLLFCADVTSDSTIYFFRKFVEFNSCRKKSYSKTETNRNLQSLYRYRRRGFFFHKKKEVVCRWALVMRIKVLIFLLIRFYSKSFPSPLLEVSFQAAYFDAFSRYIIIKDVPSIFIVIISIDFRYTLYSKACEYSHFPDIRRCTISEYIQF